ncbi:MAG: filamentous hemagglutinin N-terminal domain-containing protein, partial [Xenococcus sp. (in: cyanobacteria)]
MQRALISLFSSLPLAICGFLIPLTAQAQEVTTNITPDETLPNPTQVNHNDNTIEITGGTRTENGNNLFHSFGNFSVGTGDIASFQNVSDIANILSRVTGGNISEIDGIIRTVNSNANLYLINPNGIIFGENARLNLGGSFFASTADSLLFEDNAEFSASNPQAPPLLEVSIPIGINFRDNPGDIVNRSNLREIEIINQGTELEVNRIGLEVNQGQNITLIGGNILLEDTAITAPGGRVDLGGLSAAGEIGIHPDGSLSFPDGIARANVTLNNQAKVNVSAGEGGFININARNLTLTDESLLLGGIAKNSDSVDAQAGDITINTTSIVAKGNSIISTATNGMGNAGNINITTNTLEFNDEFSSEELAAQFFQDDLSSRLVASTFSTFGQGNGGNITVNAAGDVSFDGSGGGIFSTVGIRANDDAIQNVKGNAGNILVNANSVSITNGAGFIVSTIGEGNGGNITVNARETVNLDGLGDPIPKFPGSPRPSGLKTQVRGQEDATADKKEQVGPGIGNGGVIEINTNVLSTSRVNIQADTNGIGNAGDIIINAESITLEGIEDVEVLNSLLLTQVQQNGQGEGGDIEINTKDLKLVDSFLLADNKGQGDSGQITINATNSISLEDTPQVAQGSQIV